MKPVCNNTAATSLPKVVHGDYKWAQAAAKFHYEAADHAARWKAAHRAKDAEVVYFEAGLREGCSVVSMLCGSVANGKTTEANGRKAIDEQLTVVRNNREASARAGEVEQTVRFSGMVEVYERAAKFLDEWTA